MKAASFAALCLIWGSTWLAIKIGLVGVPPFLGAGLRFLLSTILVGAILLARRRPVTLTRHDRICVWSLGLLVFWLDYAAVYWAERRISSGLTAILFSTMPLTTAVMSRFWMRSEILSGRRLTGILVGVAGTALLFWPADHLYMQDALGMLAALAGSCCAAVNLVTMKRYGSKSDPFVLNFFGMGLGATCLLAMSAVLERSETVTWTTSNVLALVYLAALGSVTAFSIYYWLIKVMDATLVSLTTLIIPVVALTLGWFVLGESITPVAVLGVCTVLAGVGASITPVRAPTPARLASRVR
jgi:drug/metabolite transporter (DMT)-like permease